MRVVIDVTNAEKEPGGMLFAARALLTGLARIDSINDYIVTTVRPEEYEDFASIPNIHIYPVKWKSRHATLIQHQLLMPRILQRLRPDLLYVPAFAAPIAWRGPLVVTVNDIASTKVPEQSSLYPRLYHLYVLRESATRARRVMTISDQTSEEVISQWSIPAEKIRRIHIGLRSSLRYTGVSDEEIRAMHAHYGKRYLLHVGRIMPRKNVERLVEAFDIVAGHFDDLHLVLTGGTGYQAEKVLQLIENSPYKERIHLAGWVSEYDLGPLYMGASALVFPSKHEGHGLPTTEAMACGTPVVASPEAASVEIAGNAVLRADCSSAQPLAEAIARVLTDKTLRERLIRAGHIQAQPYTIEAYAKETLQVFQEAFAQQHETKDRQPISGRVSIDGSTDRLKIAFLTGLDPCDKRSWSGALYHMGNALQKHCGDVLYVGPIDAFWEKVVGRLTHEVSKRLLKKNSFHYASFLRAKRYARFTTKWLAEHSVDIIVAVQASPEIAFLHTDIPIVTVDDSTFALMHNYYPVFTNLTKRSIYQTRTIQERALKRTNAAVYSSSWATQSAITDYDVEPSRVHVVRSGPNVDTPPSRSISEQRKKTDRCVLLFMGIDWQRKGGDIAFETLLRLEEMGIDAQLIVCGCTPPSSLLHKSMTIIPFLDKNNEQEYEKLCQLFITSTFLLLPTRADCTPNVISESNAYGLPVITTRINGIPEMVKDGENGCMLPLSAKGDAYAEVIASIFWDDSKYDYMVKASRKAFEEVLNWDSWGMGMHAIIEKVLGREKQAVAVDKETTPIVVPVQR